MERFNAYIGSADSSLEQTPEILKAISVDTAIDVFYGVIHNLMSILCTKPVIGEQGVCVQGRSSLYMLPHLSLEYSLATVRNNSNSNLTSTF